MALITTTLSIPIKRKEPRYAAAFIHEEDGTWGSVVFKQYYLGGPVQVEVSLHNVAHPGGESTAWSLYNEPVHYDDNKAAEARCSSESLRGVMTGGELHKKHGLITTSHFSVIGIDYDLSLWENDKGYIIQRSLAIGNTACATVYALRSDVVATGTLPCEFHTWSDCVMEVGNGRCRRQACTGLQRFWGVESNDYRVSAVTRETAQCVQKYEMIPRVVDERVAEDGTIGCTLSRLPILAQV